ncbi:MAG: hypothetical protein KME15_21760 [Drouetiella hepatica Uher 2000/2452]|uniref:Uncharacterized protein n=1 Tax=Drouetiella hepatica Uher 2000/2452 TaxID=904376 RepID=A0A951UPX0_9CYAN|nr:hypothetical protein [Drouetiella hepatica Uher 2000/2452]
MFLIYLRLPRWRDAASNDSEAFNSRSNRSGKVSQASEAEGRSLQVQRQQAQRLRQVEAAYHLERRLFQ